MLSLQQPTNGKNGSSTDTRFSTNSTNNDSKTGFFELY